MRASLSRATTLRISLLLISAMVLAAGALAITWPKSAEAAAGGPVVLMGIDAEDGGPGGHGPIENYQDVVKDVLSRANNGGSGILVIGGGKDPNDSVTRFWDAIDSGVPASVTYVNGAANIATQSFSGFKMIAVVSDFHETSGGGLTADENQALAARSNDVEKFVNRGGGLLGFSSNFDTTEGGPYPYLVGIGNFAVEDESYSDINPTQEGQKVGVTNALDICCWHQVFTKHPKFLKVLARSANSGKVAALGGASVTTKPSPPPDKKDKKVKKKQKKVKKAKKGCKVEARKGRACVGKIKAP